MQEIQRLGAAVIAIGTSNVDSCVPWADQIGCSMAIGGDFWPHGQVALEYGVLRPEGVADRAMFLIDREGVIRFQALYPIDQVPPVAPVINALRQLTTAKGGEDPS